MREYGLLETRRTEVCSEHGAAQVAAQDREPQVGAEQARPAEIGFPQVGSAKVSAREIGVAQVGALTTTPRPRSAAFSSVVRSRDAR